MNPKQQAFRLFTQILDITDQIYLAHSNFHANKTGNNLMILGELIQHLHLDIVNKPSFRNITLLPDTLLIITRDRVKAVRVLSDKMASEIPHMNINHE